MALVKQKIGDLISPYNVACNQQLSADEISGVNREKDFFEPARQVGADTTSYKVVPSGYFACNLMHVGRDVVLPIAYNSTLKNKIVSPAYTIFCVQDQKSLNPFYLSMMMKSQEMMMIYKKYEINPMSGCLFSFLQIPLFLAFYEALNRLPVIFEGHFLGLQLGTTPMAGISNEQYYYLIVIVLVIGASYLSMKLNSTASMSKEQAAQMKMMTNMMIVFLGIASVSLSTGIAIYWVTNSTFTILQNLWVKRRKEKNA